MEEILKVPKLPESLKNEVNYEIFGKIKITKGEYQTIYPPEHKKYQEIKQAILETINFKIEEKEKLPNLLTQITKELHIKLNKEEFNQVLYLLSIEFLGLSKLEPLIQDPLITKITSTKQKTIVQHEFYGELTTNITLTTEQFENINRKLRRSGKPTQENQIQITKEKKLNPLDLIENRNASPEMMAYLWFIIEKKQPIILTENLLNIVNLFLPETTIQTDQKNINPNTEYTDQNPEYVLTTQEYKGNATPILVTKNIDEQNYIVFYIQNNTIYKVKEKGNLILQKTKDKFYHNFKQSIFLNTLENLQEIEKRTKLLILLTKNKLSTKDFRKVIAIYYKDKASVLKKAGI